VGPLDTGLTPDGELHRVLARWPALAGQGHRLRTRLSQGQIVQRARDSLRARGIMNGKARIDWAYAPTELADGQVTLTLKAMVQLPSRELADGTDEESRTIEVDLDAVE
jgi:hypothetical protein